GLGGAFVAGNARVNLDATTNTHLGAKIAIEPNGTIDVVWYDDRTGTFEVYLGRSSDGGVTWTNTVVRAPLTAGDAISPNLVVEANNTITVVWMDSRTPGSFYNIWLSRTTTGGTSWSETGPINNDVGTDLHESPVVAFAAGTTYVVWGTDRNNPGVTKDLYSATSGDGFVSNTALNDIPNDALGANDHMNPAVAFDSTGNLVCVWVDNRSGGFYDVQFAKLVSGTWGDYVRISDDAAGTHNHFNPAIALEASGTLDCVWSDDRTGLPEIFFSRSPNSGASWTVSQSFPAGQNLRVNSDLVNTASHILPCIAISPDGTFNVLWGDDRQGAFSEIFTARGQFKTP
ncbi:MAG: sialidase family protein, partial [Planctomycetota bacterium]